MAPRLWGILLWLLPAVVVPSSPKNLPTADNFACGHHKRGAAFAYYAGGCGVWHTGGSCLGLRSRRASIVSLPSGGGMNKVGDRKGRVVRDRERSLSMFTFFAPDDKGSKQRRKEKEQQQQQQQPWWTPPRFFQWGQQEEEAAKKKRGGSKKKKGEEDDKKGFWPWFGFAADFNEMWKGQLSLKRKIKKLEKEVAQDFRRGDRARAAQYRFEVMQTLDEVKKVTRDLEEIRQLDVKDAKIIDSNREIFDKDGRVVKPEDLDSLLQKERSLLQAMVLDDQQWARLGSACVGSAIGLAVFPNHDFFNVLAAGAFMTFLTTQSGLIGDIARISGYTVLSGFKAASQLERRFAVLNRVGDFIREAVEASVPFQLPWSEAPSWRNAYRGEGFLHPDIRPAPKMKDFQYVEYLREVKRWVDAEERAVITALKKKEDARIQEELDREAMKEQMQKVWTGVWEAASGLMAAAKEAKHFAREMDGGKEIQQEALKRFDDSLHLDEADTASYVAPPHEERLLDDMPSTVVEEVIAESRGAMDDDAVYGGGSGGATAASSGIGLTDVKVGGEAALPTTNTKGGGKNMSKAGDLTQI